MTHSGSFCVTNLVAIDVLLALAECRASCATEEMAHTIPTLRLDTAQVHSSGHGSQRSSSQAGPPSHLREPVQHGSRPPLEHSDSHAGSQRLPLHRESTMHRENSLQQPALSHRESTMHRESSLLHEGSLHHQNSLHHANSMRGSRQHSPAHQHGSSRHRNHQGHHHVEVSWQR